VRVYGLKWRRSPAFQLICSHVPGIYCKYHTHSEKNSKFLPRNGGAKGVVGTISSSRGKKCFDLKRIITYYSPRIRDRMEGYKEKGQVSWFVYFEPTGIKGLC
jgi:hypothetical protein